MVIRSKKVRLEWKLNPSAFALVNKETIGEQIRHLGSGVKGVSKMMEHAEELRTIMPSILGYDANSTNINWTELVKKYWSGITIRVPVGGLELETGFSYDLEDVRKKAYIKELISDKTLSIKSDEDLADYVEGSAKGKPNVIVSEKYKYGTPINPEQYMYWRFASYSREVANSVEDANKSKHIRFYLYTDEDIKEAKSIAFNLKKTASQKYLQILGNKEEVENILSIFQVEFKGMDDVEKDMALDTIVTNQPKEFLAAVNDPNLKLKATIERYIKANVLRKLPNTAIIVDSGDPSIIIGNTTDEAVSFFSSEKNKALVSEYTAKYKALVK